MSAPSIRVSRSELTASDARSLPARSINVNLHVTLTGQTVATRTSRRRDSQWRESRDTDHKGEQREKQG